MSHLMWMLLMPGVFLAIAVLYYVFSAAGLVVGSVWRAIRKRSLL
jgi:hypothetical protein